jgi:uncharacterized protein
MSRRRAAAVLAGAGVLAALATTVVTTSVRLDPDVASLLPDRGEAAALARYARAFGGGEPGLVLIEGTDRDEVAETATAVESALADLPFARVFSDPADAVQGEPASSWFLRADGDALHALDEATSPSGMRNRLAETRALLLSPGGASAAPFLTRDPLRLGQLVLERRRSTSAAGGGLASEDGLARLVVLATDSNALASADANRFVTGVEEKLEPVRRAHPTASVRLTGGHALSAATERTIKHDLVRSSAISLVLTSVLFVLLFRRPRALLAILPPLALGTLLTAATAAFFPRGLSAIAVAFASVVIGVGMDSGVHLYAAVERAKEEGAEDPAAVGRARVQRPVLAAAAVAMVAFGCLALSRVEALRQLGILCGVGEITTALALVAVTPEVAAFLVRKRSRPAVRWNGLGNVVERWPVLSRVFALAGAVAVVLLALGKGPSTEEGLVAVRPKGLAPLAVYEAIHRRFGGSERAPWVVLVTDRDPEKARDRMDSLYDALAGWDGVLRIDGLTAWAPGPVALRRRRAARDALDLPRRSAELGRALAESGLSPAKLKDAIDDLAHPVDTLDPSGLEARLRSRYLAHDGEWLGAISVEPRDPEALRARVAEIDPAAALTGYPTLDPALRRVLSVDLPRVGLAAAALVTCALAFTLRRARDVAVALFAVGAEIALVLVAMRALSVPLHLYDALVLPVLLGITLDETLFVLLALRERGATVASAVAHEAPLVSTTAFTTAAGFGALLSCDFDPLRHLGAVGALGSVLGLGIALFGIAGWVRGEETSR